MTDVLKEMFGDDFGEEPDKKKSELTLDEKIERRLNLRRKEQEMLERGGDGRNDLPGALKRALHNRRML